MAFPDRVYNVSGGGLNGVYTTVQFHFHYGPNDTVGSEHIVDGEHYAAEVSEWVNDWVDGWVNEWVVGWWVSGLWVSEWVGGWVNKWVGSESVGGWVCLFVSTSVWVSEQTETECYKDNSCIKVQRGVSLNVSEKSTGFSKNYIISAT